MHRRDWIKGGLALGALALVSPGAALGRVRSTAGRLTTRTMPIPGLLQSNGDTPIELTMRAGTWEVIPGASSPTIGFNGPFLGPTVRVRSGQDVPVVYRNNLAESVAIHGHGLHVPGELDGGPQREIEPGGTWSVELPIRQQASTCWYHPHTHGRTAPQAYQGLAGLLIIEDENSDSLPLPKNYGVDDLPVIVQDRAVDNDGRLAYSIEDPEDGFMGDMITVNGIANATRSVPAGMVRLRLLNGSNARYYRFRFSDERIFHVIASDGGLLAEPVPVRDLVMLPGERYEIVVDFSEGRAVSLVSGPALSVGANDAGRGRRGDGGRRSDWEPGGLRDVFEILQFTVDPDLPASRTPLPRRLNTITRPTLRSDWPTRRFELFMENGGRRGRRRGDRSPDTPVAMGINGRSMDMRVINERVRRHQWERWEIRSFDGSHPFHVHGCSFLVLSQDGRPVSDAAAGWKDTVRVDDSAEFIVRFEHEATDEYPYMYHCHILEHEDMGMMGQFSVT